MPELQQTASMNKNPLLSLEHRSKAALTLASALIAVLLGILDYKTGVEIHFLLIYLLPIYITSWFVSRQMGMIFALLCSSIWLIADSLGGRAYSQEWIAHWNLLMRTGVFIAFALTLAQLRTKFESLLELASSDFLTGMPNGRAFYDLAAKELDHAFGLQPMTLAFIDIAGFNWVNHRLGYSVGDQLMCSIAHTIKLEVPRPDLVGRMGGTSFAVLFPGTAIDGANMFLDKLKSALHEERKKYGQPVTFFISAIACPKAPRTIAELMHHAESQMMRMKNGKKDAMEIVQVESLPALN
jgi:diguanylate cyclase (GGDEF)-like protein